MKILFEGRLGICGRSRNFRGCRAADESVCCEEGRLAACAAALATASGFKVAGIAGGGYGEMEILVTDASWAW